MVMGDSACAICLLVCHSLEQSPCVLFSDSDQCKCLDLVFLKPPEVLCKSLIMCKGGHRALALMVCAAWRIVFLPGHYIPPVHENHLP